MDICQCRCSLLEDCVVASHSMKPVEADVSYASLLVQFIQFCCPPRLPGSSCFLLVIFIPRLFTDTDINHNELLLSGRHGKINMLFSITLDVLKSKCWFLPSKALKNMLSARSGNSLTYCIKAVLYLNISRCLRAVCVKHHPTSRGSLRDWITRRQLEKRLRLTGILLCNQVISPVRPSL